MGNDRPWSECPGGRSGCDEPVGATTLNLVRGDARRSLRLAILRPWRDSMPGRRVESALVTHDRGVGPDVVDVAEVGVVPKPPLVDHQPDRLDAAPRAREPELADDDKEVMAPPDPELFRVLAVRHGQRVGHALIALPPLRGIATRLPCFGMRGCCLLEQLPELLGHVSLIPDDISGGLTRHLASFISKVDECGVRAFLTLPVLYVEVRKNRLAAA